jgi:hypothetical protein
MASNISHSYSFKSVIAANLAISLLFGVAAAIGKPFQIGDLVKKSYTDICEVKENYSRQKAAKSLCRWFEHSNGPQLISQKSPLAYS